MERYSSHKATRAKVVRETDEDGEYMVLQLSSLYPHGIEIAIGRELWREIVKAGNEMFGANIEQAEYDAVGSPLGIHSRP